MFFNFTEPTVESVKEHLQAWKDAKETPEFKKSFCHDPIAHAIYHQVQAQYNAIEFLLKYINNRLPVLNLHRDNDYVHKDVVRARLLDWFEIYGNVTEHSVNVDKVLHMILEGDD